MDRLLLVCLGGAFGSGARYLLSGWTLAKLGASFPFGTLAVNVIGSFLLGVLVQMGASTELLSPQVRLTLGMGVMGGFTTYSTFNHETLAYMQQGAWLLAVLNVLSTVLICLIAGFAGQALVRWLAGG